jgi:hypothetical protein
MARLIAAALTVVALLFVPQCSRLLGVAVRRSATPISTAGRAPISLRVSYQQEGRLAVSAAKRLAFQRRLDPDPR